MIESDVNLRSAIENTELTQVLTIAGRNSLAAFAVRRRDRRIKLGELTQGEITDLSRHFTLPGLYSTLRHLAGSQLNSRPTIPSYDLFPISQGKVVQLSKTTSQVFRTSSKDFKEQVICID